MVISLNLHIYTSSSLLINRKISQNNMFFFKCNINDLKEWQPHAKIISYKTGARGRPNHRILRYYNEKNWHVVINFNTRLKIITLDEWHYNHAGGLEKIFDEN